MAGAVLALGGRIVLGHVLHENVARRHALDEQRADVANHGREPVFLFERIGAAHGNGFLTEAGVQTADDFILAEELDHGVFYRAVEAHVVVQVKILLPRQVLLHVRWLPAFSGSGRTIHVAARSCTGRTDCAIGAATFCDSSAWHNISSSSSTDAARMSRPNTWAKCCIKP